MKLAVVEEGLVRLAGRPQEQQQGGDGGGGGGNVFCCFVGFLVHISTGCAPGSRHCTRGSVCGVVPIM